MRCERGDCELCDHVGSERAEEYEPVYRQVRRGRQREFAEVLVARHEHALLVRCAHEYVEVGDRRSVFRDPSDVVSRGAHRRDRFVRYVLIREDAHALRRRRVSLLDGTHRVHDAGADVLPDEARVALADRVLAHALGDHAEHMLDGDPRPADGRLAAKDIRIAHDALAFVCHDFPSV